MFARIVSLELKLNACREFPKLLDKENPSDPS
jgi:hypothetical protein